jgi:UDP-N-acetylenolpyruvoylglucosamine reductase
MLVGATAAQIKKFAEEIAATVKEKTDIDIEPEVQYVE